MPRTRINGAMLAWQQLGSGPDLVLVHGLAASRAFWYSPYATRLSARFRVTLFDLRGHGYSERTPHGYSATAMARDLAGLVDALDIERATLVAHSYGGGAALEFAVAQPERVTRLALFDTRVHRLQPFQRLHDSEWLTPVEKAIAATVDHDWENEPQVGFRFLEAAARWRVAHPGEKLIGDFVPFGEGRGSRRAAQQWIDLIDHTDAQAEFIENGAPIADLATLTTPLWLAYSEHSRCFASMTALRKLLPHARCDVIAGAGHFFPRSHPDWTLRHLAAFLDAGSAARQPLPAQEAVQ